MSWSTYGIGAVSAGESFTITRSKFYRPTATTRGVIYCHGRGGDSTEVHTYPGCEPIIRALADSGHAVLSGDFGGTDAWGNSTAMSRVTDAYNYLQGTLGAKAGRVVLMGQSMGGQTALAWAAANPTLVACLVLPLPVVDLTDVWTNNRGGLTASINSAYGGAYSEATYGATKNPATMATAGKYAGMPIRIWYGDSDTTVIPSTVTAFAASSAATASSVSGGHAWTTTAEVDPNAVLTFVNANS